MVRKFNLYNARGEMVELLSDRLFALNPTGLGLSLENSYSQYQSYMIKTKSKVTQGNFQTNIVFSQIKSQTYQQFSDFVQFLAYQPYTLEYVTDSGDWKRDAYLKELPKSEAATAGLIDEQLTLEFINNWYNNKTAEYKSYDLDPNLGTYGKIYRPKYDPYVGGRNLLLGTNSNAKSSLSGGNGSYTTQYVAFNNGYKYNFSYTKASTNYSVYLFSGLQKDKFKPNTDYVLSFMANVTTDITPYVVFANGAGQHNFVKQVTYPAILSSNGDQKVVIQLRTDSSIPDESDQSLYMYGLVNKVGTFSIWDLKIESGNIPTDWTPAPEDNLTIPFGYAYAPYYVYQESNRPSNEKVMSLNNKSQYFGLQSGSPSIITVNGPCSVNPTWTVVQKGNVVATDGFALTLTDNQKLVVSSYPEDQYARIYNPDGSYVDVSQLQDYTKTNFVQIPEGESTVLFYLDADSDVNITFKEERLLV